MYFLLRDSTPWHFDPSRRMVKEKWSHQKMFWGVAVVVATATTAAATTNFFHGKVQEAGRKVGLFSTV